MPMPIKVIGIDFNLHSYLRIITSFDWFISWMPHGIVQHFLNHAERRPF
ncbi:hypothetical protein U8V97_17980 [Priestia filamentosa]|nr:hypothetical protein [Priestia filamentosa]